MRRRPNEPTAAEIRALLNRQLVVPRRAGEPVLLIGELAVGLSVADVVRVGDVFAGFEIKGAGDTLRRLPLQALGYGQHFEECSLVAIPRLAERAALEMPAWWWVHAVHRADDGQLVSRCLREGAPNPEYPARAITLLWTFEVTHLLRCAEVDCPPALAYKCGSWLARHTLDAILTPEARLAAVRWCFRARAWHEWRVNSPVACPGDETRDEAILTGGRTVPDDWLGLLEKLPHYHDDRHLRRSVYFALPNRIKEAPGVAERLLGPEAPLFGPRLPAAAHPVLLTRRGTQLDLFAAS
jgi:hypothetical protein